MKKVIIISLIFLVFSISCEAGVIQQNVIFINCTNQEVHVTNPSPPYKFSLTAEKAKNGYSTPTDFTLPKDTLIYKSPNPLTGFSNGYVDAAMTLTFSGGVSGNLDFKQLTFMYDYETVQISSSSANIQAFPTQANFVISTEYKDASNLPILIALGCNKINA